MEYLCQLVLYPLLEQMLLKSMNIYIPGKQNRHFRQGQRLPHLTQHG
jgi:hypothetical protein